MKILFVINSSNNGGAIKMIVTLYKEIVKSYPESKIVFLKKIISQYSEIENAYYLSDRLSSPLDYLNVYKKLYNVIDSERPNAIISFLPLSNILSSVIGKKLGIQNRIVSQRNPPFIYGKVVRAFDRYLGSKGYYTANVCNSEAGMEAFGNYPPPYKDLLSVIHNSVEKADFSIDKAHARNRFETDENKVIITCVGRLHEQKNHELLIRSMKYVTNGRLYCAGDGPLRKDIEELINTEKVSDKVVLLGDLDREEVRLLLRATDVFIIPSKYEGLSNSLIEAMSYKLPIIFSNIPSFTSFMKEGKSDSYAGILVKGDSPKEWGEVINKLVNDRITREIYGNKSLEKVESLTEEKMASKFLSLIS